MIDKAVIFDDSQVARTTEHHISAGGEKLVELGTTTYCYDW